MLENRINKGFFDGGATQIWTGDKGVADPCLTTWLWHHFYKKDAKYIINFASFYLERITRLELATSTLARLRSTRWAKSAYKEYVAR